MSQAVPGAQRDPADAGPPATRAQLPAYARAQLGWIADTDEVAALLEAGGVNDRVAEARYGAPSVFALAHDVRRVAGVPAQSAALGVQPESEGARRGAMVSDALMRASLFLTPAALAVGAARWLAGQPWQTTTGLLVVGWSTAQALSYMGFCAAGAAGVAVAARRLALGFGALAAAWAVLLAVAGVDLRGWLVSGAQLALFAANAAALVTGRERIVLPAAACSWVAAAGLATVGGPGPVVLLGLTLLAMPVLAYAPAVRRDGRTGWRPRRAQIVTAAAHGLAGAGQAMLFILVVLAESAHLPMWTALPLLAGIPLTELMLTWHWQRAARGRARLSGQRPFLRHLTRGAIAGAAALLLPLAAGLALAARAHATARPALWALAAATLLAGVQALCLILAAHRRPALAAATAWCLASLVVAAAFLADGLVPGLPAIAAGTAVLLFGYPFAFVPAVSAMIDPWSHR